MLKNSCISVMELLWWKEKCKYMFMSLFTVAKRILYIRLNSDQKYSFNIITIFCCDIINISLLYSNKSTHSMVSYNYLLLFLFYSYVLIENDIFFKIYFVETPFLSNVIGLISYYIIFYIFFSILNVFVV